MFIIIKISRKWAFLGPDKPRMLIFPLINVEMPTIEQEKLMLSANEHEKSFITSGTDVTKSEQ